MTPAICRMEVAARDASPRRGFVRWVAQHLVLGLTLVVAGRLPAQTLYWDTNGSTNGAGSTPTGTWSSAGTNWSTSLLGSTATTTWTSGASAVFSAGFDATGSYTVTVSGTQNVSSLTSSLGSPTLTGGTLNFNDASPDVWTIAGSTMTINSGITGTNGINKTGGGTLILGASDKAYSGTTTISAGNLQLNFNQTFDTVNLAGGALVLNSAATTITNLNLTANSTIDFAAAASLAVSTLNLNGFTLTIKNWLNVSDYFFATNWTGATPDTANAAPMNQVVFQGFSASDTKWMPYGSHEVTPVPEPAAYGTLLLGVLGGFFAWRRRRVSREPVRQGLS